MTDRPIGASSAELAARYRQPIAHVVTVAVAPSDHAGTYLVSSWDETAEDGPWNTSELPPRVRGQGGWAAMEAPRRVMAVLAHLSRTQPDRRVSEIRVNPSMTADFRADAGLPDSTVYTVETRLA